MIVDGIQYLTTAQVADIVGKGHNTVRRYGDSGDLSMIRDGDGTRWFDPRDLPGYDSRAEVVRSEHQPLPDHGSTGVDVYRDSVYCGFSLEHGCKLAGIGTATLDIMTELSLVIPWGGLGGPRYMDEEKVEECKAMMSEYQAWLAQPSTVQSQSKTSAMREWKKFASDRSARLVQEHFSKSAKKK